MSRILIIRFSAFGDVAMTVPVIHSFATNYPQHRITVLSRAAWQPLFAHLPDNVEFMGVDLKQEYQGFKGLNALYARLAAMRFDYVADLHSVLRTNYLALRFRLSGKKVCRIDKGRKEKKRLAKCEPKDYTPLKSSFERYRLVFQQLGFPFEVKYDSLYGAVKGDKQLLPAWLQEKMDSPVAIGVAPFAAHAGKIYPLEQMEQVIARLQQREDVRIYLFGGKSAEEAETFARWQNNYPRVVSVAGCMKLSEELVLMSHLNVMVSMDSSNMHLASLVGTPVVSVWGATHPCAGFMGWKQPAERAVQVELSCRPCSIYGNKPCKQGDYPCLRSITPEMIVEKVLRCIPFA